MFGVNPATDLNPLVNGHLAAWVEADTRLGCQIQYFAANVDLVAAHSVHIPFIDHPGHGGLTTLLVCHADLLRVQHLAVPAAPHVHLGA